MSGIDFTTIATRYERDSLVQRTAAETLISLLDIRRDDDILDLGSGAGNLTRRLRELTGGSVVGIDLAEGMVREAEEKRGGLDIQFAAGNAESLSVAGVFTVIFCNSTFQWFRDPGRALRNCHRALKPGGRMGIQAPAKKIYCPVFIAAMDAVGHDPRTARTFTGFRSPWLFRESADEYASLFRDAGFSVPFAKIETITTLHAPDEVMAIFESGAAAGYLNQEYYQDRIDNAYVSAFREIVRTTFKGRANPDGKVNLTFNRIYLVGVKA